MSGIPLTDEGVTSDGGAGETISLPPKTSMFLTPRKYKMSTELHVIVPHPSKI